MHIEELSLVAVGGLILVVAVAMLAGRVQIAAPLILVVVGIGIGYIPGVPLIEVEPEIPARFAAIMDAPRRVVDLPNDVQAVKDYIAATS